MTGSAIASLAVVHGSPAWAATAADPTRTKSAIPFHLGIASYTLRKFDLDHALAMTRRVGLDRICLKSMHLPLDAKPAEITAAVEKVKHAGLSLYGGGVISMKNEREIGQAFEYAKAAGMLTITAAPCSGGPAGSRRACQEVRHHGCDPQPRSRATSTSRRPRAFTTR